MDGWMGGWMDGWMDGWTDGWMDGRTDGWMNGWMDGWMDRRWSRWMDRWIVIDEGIEVDACSRWTNNARRIKRSAEAATAHKMEWREHEAN